MRVINADEALQRFDNDFETMKARIEGKVPFQVGAAMVSAAKELRTNLKEYLDRTPTLDYVPRQQWISVKDRLPEDHDHYLVWVSDACTVERAMYCGDGEWMTEELEDLTRFVTHWMLLPEPPEEDAE